MIGTLHKCSNGQHIRDFIIMSAFRVNDYKHFSLKFYLLCKFSKCLKRIFILNVSIIKVPFFRL